MSNTQLNKKTPYPYNDKVTFESTENDVHLRVIENEKGSYIDIRKFFSGRPSTKGVRLPVDAFDRLIDAYQHADIEEKKDDSKENETPNPSSSIPIRPTAMLTTVKKNK